MSAGCPTTRGSRHGKGEQNSHRSVSVILDGFDFDLSATHCEGFATVRIGGAGVQRIGVVGGVSSLFPGGYGLAALAVISRLGRVQTGSRRWDNWRRGERTKIASRGRRRERAM